MPKKYFSTTEAAKIIGISRIAIFKKIKTGSLPAIQVGRNFIIAKDDLLILLKKQAKKQERIEARKRKQATSE